MLLSTPFTAVTNLSIEACAEEVSGLTVSVVGVLGGRCLLQIERHAGDGAADHDCCALVAAKPLIEKLASCAA